MICRPFPLNRTSFLSIALGLLVPWSCMPAGAQLPDGGVRLVDPGSLSPSNMSVRVGNGELGSSSLVNVQHEAFDQALQINLTKRPPNTWDAGISAKTTGEISEGDHLVFGFWARGKSTDETSFGGAVAEFVFERNGAPYTKSIQYLIETPANGDWQHFWVRCRSLEDYEPGGALINFQVGYIEEELQLAGIEAWNFGNRVPLEELPFNELTYFGREPDAAWRVEADKRIEQHRKGDVQIRVVDEDGNAKVGVPVHVKMDRLAFDLGTAVNVDVLLRESEDADRYR